MIYLNIIPFTRTPINSSATYTYSGEDNINWRVGQIAEIKFGHRSILGIIIAINVDKPIKFAVKPINKLISSLSIFTDSQIKLAEWISGYYYCPIGIVLKAMSPKIPKKEVAHNEPKKSTQNIKKGTIQVIKSDQKNRLTKYIDEIKNTIKLKKQVIIVEPEIILALQMIDILSGAFPEANIISLHSNLSTGDFFRNWMKSKNGQADIIIGSRQAIFAPTNNLGLIIIDEEHSQSHKQWDMSPRYDTRSVALKINEQQNVKLIFGSASPSIKTFYNFKNKFTENKTTEKNVIVADMRNEMRSGNYSIFSHSLTASIQKSLSNNQQVILFVNRRASSSSFMCRDCGLVIKCEKCDLPMSQYSSGKLVCLHCNHQIIPPKKCPKCQSDKIKGFGIGTEKVAESAAQMFNTKVVILDQDKLKKKNDPHNIYQTFETGKASILVCTQAGLSLTSNNLQTIGIINIDSLLNMPDWHADEKVYSLISQAVNNVAQEIIIQTYNPENEILNMAANQDYEKYCQKELKMRQQMNYPPFCHLIKLTFKDKDSKKINQAISELQDKMKKLNIADIKLLTPRKTKINDIFSCSISIKIKNIEDKKIILNVVPSNWSIDVDPESLL